MLSIKDSNRTNRQLCQFQPRFASNVTRNFDSALDTLDDINIIVASTSYLKLKYPEFIGNTVMHFARGEIDLNTVLSHGADFTIKNQNNFTILHLILRFSDSNNFRYLSSRSPLHDACVNLILSAHLKTKNPANPYDGNGMSHFHVACMANHVEAVEFFLDNDISIDHAMNSDSPYFAGFTPLHLAIRFCSLDVAKVLLKRGANIYIENADKITALTMVIENYLKFSNDNLLGYFDSSDLSKKYVNNEIAKLLLEIIRNNGTTIIDDSGLSCFHLACTVSDITDLEEYIFGDINDSVKIGSALWPAGYTALHFAAHMNIDTVKILVKKGANLVAKAANGVTPLDLCLKIFKTEDMYNILSLSSALKKLTFAQSEVKLLDLVSAMRDYKQLAIFLDRFAKRTLISIPADSPVWPNFTPMHLIILFSGSLENGCNSHKGTVHEKYLQMIKALFKNNKKIITARDIHGCTPLHLSFRLNKVKSIVDLLLTMHCSFPLDLVDDEDLSLLHIACTIFENSNDFVEKLLARSSKNVNLAYKGKPITNLIESGWTPLHMAVANNNHHVMPTLLKYGADVTSEDAHGVTPIHLLILLHGKQLYGNDIDESSKILLSAQILKEKIIKGIGLSHLHVACFMKNKNAIKNLLRNGSDVNIAITSNSKVTDTSFELSNLIEYLGCTPLQIFLKNNKINLDRDSDIITIFDLLTQHGADIIVGDSGSLFSYMYSFKKILPHLKKDDNLLKQLETKIGLMKLHIACSLADLEWLKSSLDVDPSVNRKINDNSPYWPGSTALHIVMDTYYKKAEIKAEFVRLLLNNGADVTIQNTKQESPMHRAYGSDGSLSSSFGLLKMMLNAQNDFSINPTNADGISHFHIACFLSENAVIKKFLKRGNLDINQPIDFFIVTSHPKYYLGGFTPLHMAAIHKEFIDVSSQLQTVDLLLKNGADPDYKNSHGNTPLHAASRYEIFERIARDCADVNTINVNGDTPLGDTMTGTNLCNFRPYFDRGTSVDEMIKLLKLGCQYNAFNIFTEKGYIGLSINKIPFDELQNMIKIVSINMPHVLRDDKASRTVIHNFASTQGEAYYRYTHTHAKDVSINQYATFIELLASTGCDIDSQDNLGRTALHLAAKFQNLKAISALLMIGADLNICDKNAETVLAGHVAPCKSCYEYGESGRKVIPELCDVFKILADQVRKMQYCQLDISQSDEFDISKENYLTSFNEQFYEQLKETKNVKIGSVTLRSFISETNAVANYPYMSEFERDAIDDFFYRDGISNFREKFSEVAGLLILQYRKAVRRTELIKNAKISLNFLADFQVPELCSRHILGFLSNYDLKNLIASTVIKESI